MDYGGRYDIFDVSQISTYPLSTRSNKVMLDGLIGPEDLGGIAFEVPDDTRRDIAAVAREIVSCRKSHRPVVVFSGAHLIKNGMGPLLADLVDTQNEFDIVFNQKISVESKEKYPLISETRKKLTLYLDALLNYINMKAQLNGNLFKSMEEKIDEVIVGKTAEARTRRTRREIIKENEQE